MRRDILEQEARKLPVNKRPHITEFDVMDTYFLPCAAGSDVCLLCGECPPKSEYCTAWRDEPKNKKTV